MNIHSSPEDRNSAGAGAHIGRTSYNGSSDWEKMGIDLFDAMHEVAYDTGGSALAQEVTEAAFEDYDLLPSSKAFILLTERDSNAITAIVMRRRQITAECKQAEIDSRFPIRALFRRLGKSIAHRQR